MTNAFPLSENEKSLDNRFNILNEGHSELHDLITSLFIKIQRLEQHTGCNKYVLGLDGATSETLKE